MTEAHHTPSRIPQLEVLRVLATLSVFLFHLWTQVPLTTQVPGLGLALAQVPLLGAIGVVIFNVVTGFVLAMPYLGVGHPRLIPPALTFFRQRFGRICRHYYPALGLWSLLALLLPSHGASLSTFLVGLATHLVFVHTLHLSTFFALVPAFWWLGLLAQLYLVCPWLLRLCQRLGAAWTCAGALLVSWGLWIGVTWLATHVPGSGFDTLHYLLYFNLPFRLPEFVLGMWLAEAWNNAAPLLHCPPRTFPAPFARAVLLPSLLALALLSLLPNVFQLPLGTPYGHFYLVGWCLALILCVMRWPYASHLGTTPWLLNLAGASYGIYLLHQPLLGYADLSLTGLGLSPTPRCALLLVGVGVGCYYAAVGLNHLVLRLWD